MLDKIPHRGFLKTSTRMGAQEDPEVRVEQFSGFTFCLVEDFLELLAPVGQHGPLLRSQHFMGYINRTRDKHR